MTKIDACTSSVCRRARPSRRIAADRAVGAGAVVDDELLPGLHRELLREVPRHHVDRAAWRIRHDDRTGASLALRLHGARKGERAGIDANRFMVRPFRKCRVAPAVDEQTLPGDVSRLRRAQVRARGAELARRTVAPGGIRCKKVVLNVPHADPDDDGG
jgi:hypothetical protein